MKESHDIHSRPDVEGAKARAERLSTAIRTAIRMPDPTDLYIQELAAKLADAKARIEELEGERDLSRAFQEAVRERLIVWCGARILIRTSDFRDDVESAIDYLAATLAESEARERKLREALKAVDNAARMTSEKHIRDITRAASIESAIAAAPTQSPEEAR